LELFRISDFGIRISVLWRVVPLFPVGNVAVRTGGACAGTAEFSVGRSGDPTGHFANGEAGKQNLKVTVTTLDRAMERFGRPDFIKMDIEGAEVEALAGAERVLKEARPTMLIELHGPDCERGVRRILSEQGYGFFDLRNNPIPGDAPLPHHVVAKVRGEET
jgi:hypothetical protein